MGLEDQPKIPNAAASARAGIQADVQNQPLMYLINAAAELGHSITLDGKTYDFSGQGQAATAGKVSDQMAQTLLDLQKETSPAIIRQRLAELQAADPQGYAARQQLFDRIMADANNHPDRPVSTELQQDLQNELAKGSGFDDAKQEQQVRDSARGGQVSSNIFLGNAPASEEAKTVVNAGEALQSQRQQNALNLLQSGASPEDVQYREFEQSLNNLGSFVNGQTPTAEFGQVSSAASGPASVYGTPATNTGTFSSGAAQNGMNNALGIYGGLSGFMNSQANPWLSAFSTAATTTGTLNRLGAFG
jgi:hypothetical protein